MHNLAQDCIFVFGQTMQIVKITSVLFAVRIHVVRKFKIQYIFTGGNYLCFMYSCDMQVNPQDFCMGVSSGV